MAKKQTSAAKRKTVERVKLFSLCSRTPLQASLLANYPIESRIQGRFRRLSGTPGFYSRCQVGPYVDVFVIRARRGLCPLIKLRQRTRLQRELSKVLRFDLIYSLLLAIYFLLIACDLGL
jgi:hypothetical protein